MKQLYYIVITFLLLTFNTATGQQFWHLTNEFPGGHKTSITAANDSVLFVGLTNGIIKSTDWGQHFDTSLSATAVVSILSTKQQKVLAGGIGIIYHSSDYGLSWDSIKLSTQYPVNEFCEDKNGILYGITGAVDKEEGYVGDGIFVSEDGGLTWVKRNSGLGNMLCCDQIASDKNGRIYLTVNEELPTGKGGLYISDNKGLDWEHISVKVDGRNTIYDHINVYFTTGLSVLNDTLFMSIAGSAFNSGVDLNLKKNIEDVNKDNNWDIFPVFNSVSFWLDRKLGDIVSMSNGHRYSSFRGTQSTGGTYFNNGNTGSWQRNDYGLGISVTGYREKQMFTENSAGTIFMVQWLDERIYWKEPEETTVQLPETKLPSISISPNPVIRNSIITIEISGPWQSTAVEIYDLNGKSAGSFNGGNTITIQSPENSGLYILDVKTSQGTKMQKLIVN
ncbi:T9SS type A sorting domain-containing protein [Saccharicrinis sp. FJH62]|uniref:T9SS type A sorting domain-containing protein n=1 Tax=Saccharicrinis sp. FJH62 TaxID=3344657 RepID=UPI0035D461A3